MSMAGPELPRRLADGGSPLDGLTTTWRLLRGALLRRWRIALACFIATLALTTAALIWMPREYLVEARILTNPGYLIPSLAHPQRAVPREAQNATRGATEQLKSRDSLLALVEGSDLAARWRATRVTVGRAIDRLREAIAGPISPSDLREALVHLLDRKLWGSIDGDSIVISVRWHDPGTALALVDTATQQFLEARRQRELGEINDTIALLERSVLDAQPALDAAAAELERVAGKSSTGGRPLRVPGRPRDGDSDVGQRDRGPLEQELTAKRREIQQLEGHYQQQLQRAQADLQTIQTTLGPQHPDVTEALRAVERASIPPQELTGLRTEEANLINRLKSLDSRAASSPREVPVEAMLGSAEPLMDPAMERAMDAYREAETRHSELSRRVANARMELASAQAAFSYRYVVTQPPILPQRAISPRPAKFLGGGLVAGLFLALLFAVLAELRAGRVLEAWQLERLLDVRVLGEFKEP